MRETRELFFLTIVIVFLPQILFGQSVATDIKFVSSLKMGDSGSAVLALQKILNSDKDTSVAVSGLGSPGMETDFFGSLTKNAVIRFQEKYRADVLYPVGLSKGTGFVGEMTIKKLNFISSATPSLGANQIVKKDVSAVVANNISSPVNLIKKPIIASVFPQRAGRGEEVKIFGEGFSKTGNIVLLGDGMITKIFDNLSSPDGKMISFYYEPPEVKVMNEFEIRSLPKATVSQIEDPIKAAGKTLKDAIYFYDGIKNKTEFEEFLKTNGREIKDTDYHFFVIVKNQNGETVSDGPVLFGSRSLPFDRLSFLNKDKIQISDIGDILGIVLDVLMPKAYAQGNTGGGFTTGIVMVCTCGSGYLTFQMDYSQGGGSGLYYFSPGFRPDAGTGLVAGFWLGGYQQSAGTCSIGVRPYCVDITANTPQNPWGSSM